MKLLKNMFDNFEEYACVAAISLMILSLGAQILVRSVFGGSLAWSEELSRFCFIWTVFLGMAVGAKKLAHVRITAGVMLLPDRLRLAIRMMVDALWIVFSLFIAYHGLELIEEGLRFPEISPTLHVTKAYVEVIIPFCFVLTPLRIIETYWKAFRSGTLLQLARDGQVQMDEGAQTEEVTQ